MGEQAKAPGLKWMRRKGAPVPYWVASLKGYPVRTVNLAHLAHDTAALEARCSRLQAEMLQWASPVGRDRLAYDGTIRALLRVYELHQDSSYRELKAHSRELYDSYIPLLRDSVGARRVDAITGLDVKRWFATWRAGEHGRDHLAKARVILAVLKAATTFGVVCGYRDCRALREVLGAMTFDSLAPREAVVTAAMVDKIRAAAHAAGRPSIAFACALQFETTARQWDIVGNWLPMSDPTPSTVLHKGRKWVGPTWAAISDDLVLTLRPSKTDRTTRAIVQADLSLCPMVTEELGHIPPERRRGPLIIDERTGEPYRFQAFGVEWRKLARAAGIPDSIWNRDLRAGGVTEGRKAGAATEDLARGAGHKGTKTTARVYDRDVLEAQRRSARARGAFRKRNGD